MQLPDFVRAIVEELKKNPKVFAIYLFGSRAKGETKVYSDWDLCVFAENLTEDERNHIGATSNDFVDVVLFDEIPIWIQFEVFKYGKPIYLKDQEKIKKLKFDVLRKWLDFKYFYEVALRERVKELLRYLQIS